MRQGLERGAGVALAGEKMNYKIRIKREPDDLWPFVGPGAGLLLAAALWLLVVVLAWTQ